MSQSIVSQLFVYPVKSLAGIAVSTWQVNAKGLLHDRKWMLIDRNLCFLSQRKIPKMALIKTQLTDTQLILSTSPDNSISLPINPSTGDTRHISIWHDSCISKTTSTVANQWLSDFLEVHCQLVYQPDEVLRPVDSRYAQKTDHINFTDGFPFLLTSQASLDALNSAMNLTLSMTRFRPNIVVSQCQPYAEDGWREISINGIDFRLPKPCSRCSVPTIDPDTAKTNKEPLTTLNRLRKWHNRVYFGQNMLHNNCGQLTVGNTVRIINIGAKQPPL